MAVVDTLFADWSDARDRYRAVAPADQIEADVAYVEMTKLEDILAATPGGTAVAALCKLRAALAIERIAGHPEPLSAEWRLVESAAADLAAAVGQALDVGVASVPAS